MSALSLSNALVPPLESEEVEPITSEPSEVKAIESYWLRHAQRLSTEEKAFFKTFLHWEMAKVCREILKLSLSGCCAQQIRQAIAVTLAKLNDNVRSFLSGCSSYHAKKGEIAIGLEAMTEKIKQATLNLDDFVFSTVPSSELKKPTFHGKSIVQHCGSIVAEKIGHAIGKRTGTVFDLSFQTCAAPAFERSTSEWRDAVVSASIEIGMTEVIASCIKTQWPAWLTMLGIETAARVSVAVEPTVRKFENWHIPDLHNLGVTLHENSLALSMTAKALQAPQALLHLINEKLTTTLAPCLTTLGLTDENISKVTCHTIDLIAKYAPDLMEERVWVAAHEARLSKK